MCLFPELPSRGLHLHSKELLSDCLVSSGQAQRSKPVCLNCTESENSQLAAQHLRQLVSLLSVSEAL